MALGTTYPLNIPGIKPVGFIPGDLQGQAIIVWYFEFQNYTRLKLFHRIKNVCVSSIVQNIPIGIEPPVYRVVLPRKRAKREPISVEAKNFVVFP